MAFIVVYDANVLVPARLRDLLLRIAISGAVRARWTEEILDEVMSARKKLNPDIEIAKLNRLRNLMIKAVPDCTVEGYRGLADDLDLIDEGDRHVIAAAIRCGAQAIVTTNLKHFPEHALARFDIEVKHPDEFVLETIDLNPARFAQILSEMSGALTNPPQTVPEILDTLQRQGLTQSVARIRELLNRK